MPLPRPLRTKVIELPRAAGGAPSPSEDDARPPEQDYTGQVDANEGPPAASTDVTAELENVRAERDAAVQALDKRGRRTRRRQRVRRIFVGTLVLLFAILLPITITATWAHRIVLNTDTYVSTVGPVAANPTVQAAISRDITNQLYAALDPQQTIEEALPPRASFLAGPIANGVKGYVQNAVNRVVSSQQFQDLWVAANRYAHGQLVSVLRGNSDTVRTSNGQVVLDLVPLLNEALKQIQPFVSSVVGRNVNLPDIKGNELPSAACKRIADALDRPIPATCGQVPLFPAAQLHQAQRGVRGFDRAVLALLIITPLLFLISMWLSRRRRRTLLQLTIGGTLGLVIFRRTLFWLQGDLINTGRPENKAARSVIIQHVLTSYFSITKWFLVGALVIAVLALVTGPYGWAVKGRQGVVHAGAATVSFARASVASGVAASKDERTVAWVRAHFDFMRAAGVVAAVLLFLILNVSFWGFVVIAALLVLYELWLYRLRPQDVALPDTAAVATASPSAPTVPGQMGTDPRPSAPDAKRQ